MKLVKTKLNDLSLWYRENDKFIGQRIALDKYEKYETAMILSQVNKDSVVIDVGANIGYYTLLLSKFVKKVYAFEPDKENFEILKKNVEENNLKNVVLINKAVGEKSDKGYLIKDKENFGNSQVKTPQSSGQLPLTGEPVQIVTLDDFIDEKTDLIKIDVQGYEPKVLTGAKNLIKKYKPILFVESEKEIKIKGYGTWSINDFAESSWPIWKGFVIKNNHGYTDLWMKNKFTVSDYLTMLKNVNYKKWVKGIMNSIWQR